MRERPRVRTSHLSDAAAARRLEDSNPKRRLCEATRCTLCYRGLVVMRRCRVLAVLAAREGGGLSPPFPGSCLPRALPRTGKNPPALKLQLWSLLPHRLGRLGSPRSAGPRGHGGSLPHRRGLRRRGGRAPSTGEKSLSVHHAALYERKSAFLLRERRDDCVPIAGLAESQRFFCEKSEFLKADSSCRLDGSPAQDVRPSAGKSDADCTLAGTQGTVAAAEDVPDGQEKCVRRKKATVTCRKPE